MPLTEETNLELESRYELIMALIRVKGNDKELEIAEKRKAKVMGLKLVAQITILLQEASSDSIVRLHGMLAAAYFILANICYYECMNEEENVEHYLMESLNTIQKFKRKQYLMLLKLSVLNMMADVLRLRNHEEALEYLDKAEEVFDKHGKFTAVEVDDMFLQSANPLANTNRTSFEERFSETMYLRARIHKNLNDDLKWAVYTHKGLDIELKCVRFEHITWVHRAILVSKIFVNKRGFKQARHILAAAQYILEVYENHIRTLADEDALTEYSRTKAELFESWSGYGLALLRFCKLTAAPPGGRDNRTTDLAQSALVGTSATKEDIESLVFAKLNFSVYENQITDQIIVTPLEARRVYKIIDKWLDDVLLVHSDPLSDAYVRVAHNRSISYLSLAVFEENSKMRTILHQKRIDLFEKLNSTIDQLSKIHWKGIWQELARSYYDFIVAEHLTYADQPTTASEDKINSYVKKSMGNYRNYLRCLRNPETNEYPERILMTDDEIDFLEANITLALTYQKFINPTKEELLRYERVSKRLLEVVVNYCERNPDAREHLNITYNKCRITEMYLKLYHSSRKLVIPISFE